MKTKKQPTFILSNAANLIPVTILISNSDGYYLVRLETIVYCASSNAYTTFHLVNNVSILISQNLKVFESALSGYGFMRIHQTSLINILHLTMIMKKEGGCCAMMDNGVALDVARERKTQILEQLKEGSV